MLLWFGVISWLYIYLRAIRKLKLSLPWQIILCIISAAAAFKFQILRRLGGGLFFAPELPGWILYLTAIIYGTYFLFFLILLPSDLIFSLIHLISDKISGRKTIRLKAERILICGVFVSALILALVGFVNIFQAPQITRYQIFLDQYHGRELKIALLSDLHIDPATAPGVIDRIVSTTNALAPDIIAIVGDFADGKLEKRKAEVKKLAGLHAPFGVFGVSGNHEFYFDYREMMDFLQQNGIAMLENRHVVINNELILAGISDDTGKRCGIGSDIRKALAGADAELPVILLAHRPKSFEENRNFCQLQLSGHTHGGMILGMNVAVALLNGFYVSGLYQDNGSTLIVSNGTRLWSGFPFRIGVPAEILLITISGKEENIRHK